MNIYIKSINENQIKSVCAEFKNVIGPIQGINSFFDSEGNLISAKGDSSYWYALITSESFYVLPYNDIEVATEEECIQVCGYIA